MPKRALILSSHMLSDYQTCPARYKLSRLEELVPRKDYRPFSRGAIITRMLEEYYKAKRNGTLGPKEVLRIVQEILHTSDLSDEDKGTIEFRFYAYYKFYRNETLIPVAMETECAFSRVLYEDDSWIFIYEGKPDAVFLLSPTEKIRVIYDHKHESRKSAIYPFNNQAMGYCWGLDIPHFAYNYFSLIESKKPEDWFRRSPYYFNAAILQRWKESTTKWFFKIAHDEEFLESWQCTGKYGVCWYKQICEQPLDSIKLSVKERFYQIEQKQRSWEIERKDYGDE